jgi:hypothetical protein
MGRHSRHRHAAPRSRPPDGGRAERWRQIIRTPTFALGLAVVAAAVLAFGTTQTYLRFSGSGPDQGCGPAGCAAPAASPSAPPGSPATTHSGSPGVQITYRTLSTWATGFTGELMISNRSRNGIAGWRLAISYKRSQVTDVTGAQWLPRASSTGGTLEPDPASGPLGPHRSVRISYTATGTPHAPTGCDFNGVRCKIK